MAGLNFGNVSFVGNLKPAGGPAVVYRFNCGTATSYTDAAGNVWAGLSGQNFNYATAGFPSPEPDRPLYENVLNPAQTIAVPLPNGVYQVSTRLREMFNNFAGGRPQSLRVTGETNAANYIFTDLEGWQANRLPITYTSTILVTVTTGTLSLDIFSSNSPTWQTLIFTKQ